MAKMFSEKIFDGYKVYEYDLCGRKLVVENGKMAGHVGMSFFCGEGYITNVAVRENYRKRGIGTGLIETLLSFAKDKELEFVSLEVRASNNAAIKLYKKCGFELIGERKNFYTGPTENALIMTRLMSK